MSKANITTTTGREKLEPRREPYWVAAGDAFLGYRKGPDTWIGRLRVDGKQVYQALGTHPDYKAAAKALKDWLALRDLGVTDTGLTVADAMARYVDHLRRERGDRPANDALSRIERRVTGRKPAKYKDALPAHPLARVKLADLRRHHLVDWRDGLLPDGAAASTQGERASVQRDMVTVKAALSHAFQLQMVSTDAAWAKLPGFKGTSAGNDAHEYLTLQQRRKLLAVAQPGVRELLLGMMLLGARPSELERATVADFDSKAGTLRLYHFKGRGAEQRVRQVPLGALPGALEHVKAQAKSKLPGAMLWTRADGKPWGRTDHLPLVREAMAAAGIEASAYSLRHSFITDGIAAGVPLVTLGQTTGTSARMIEATYAKTVAQHAKNAFARMVAL